MKRFAERHADLAFNKRPELHRGYLAPCSKCGFVVVHAEKTHLPFHMHRYSKLCRLETARRKRLLRAVNRANVFVNSRKIAELESLDFTLQTGRTEITANVIRLLPGAGGEMEEVVNTQSLVTITYRYGTEIRYDVFKCVSWRAEGRRHADVLRGTFVFSAHGW